MSNIKDKKLINFKRNIISRLKNIVSERFILEDVKVDEEIKIDNLKFKGSGRISNAISNYRNDDVCKGNFIFMSVMLFFSATGLSLFILLPLLENQKGTSLIFASISFFLFSMIYFVLDKKTIAEYRIEKNKKKKESLKKNKVEIENKVEKIFDQYKYEDLIPYLKENINLETLNEIKEVFSEEELKSLIGRLEDDKIKYKDVIDLIRVIEKEDKTNMIYKSLFGFKNTKKSEKMREAHYS